MLQHPSFPPIIRKRRSYETPIGISDDLVSDVKGLKEQRECISARFLPNMKKLSPSFLLSTIDKFTFGSNELLFGVLPADECRVLFTINAMFLWCPTPAHGKLKKPYIDAMPILNSAFRSSYCNIVEVSEIDEIRNYFSKLDSFSGSQSPLHSTTPVSSTHSS